MAISKQEFSDYIKEFTFRELFNDMGWNNDITSQSIIVDDKPYQLRAVAEKSGFRIFVCLPDESGNIPENITRKKIEIKVTKLFHEHLIIFIDNNKKNQIWQLVVRQTGRPNKMTETRYNVSQDPELLYQRTSGLFFSIDEEDKITIVDVTQRVSENFQQNAERITKQFYDKFKDEHDTFLSFINGINDKVDKEWYASLMLNRLMFCYFIQKKRFLDGNSNYLRDKLLEYQRNKGKNKFFSFYKQFLVVLFHEGIGKPYHNEELKKEIGNIPYLNGGLFDEHELENFYANIDIKDEAFERIFDFFDEYEWHLDTREIATGKEINPDVIGYIFEKYINDRAEMGAYYTKEDITDYISKNCIIPFLFNETETKYPEAFAPNQEMFLMLKNSGDIYINESIKYGINGEDIYGDIPYEIAIGIAPDQPDLVEKRKGWNKPAPIEIALPNETWRELIDRRKQYDNITTKIKNGEISNINDLITNNLDILQFVQDALELSSDEKFIEYFYESLSKISILDPTCGSGAFLFAAMNILEPLYEACLRKIEEYSFKSKKEESSYSKRILSDAYANENFNKQYFIFKTIILKNIYGVDIMKEAVEISKLRLFLKLVSTIEPDTNKPNFGLDPLPDIDFNIRAGNTLVGFATEDELGKGLRYTLDGLLAKPSIEAKCDLVSESFNNYKQVQLNSATNYEHIQETKKELKNRLIELNNELNKLLHKQASGINYEKWLTTHRPFHWFAEFNEIIQDRGGFDVIIGNPPYIRISKIEYKLNFGEFNCPDIYGYVIHRCLQLLKVNSRFGFIVMHNLAFSKHFDKVRKSIKSNISNGWFSFFARIPAGLFSGDVRVRNCIFIVEKKSKSNVTGFYTTRIHRWFAEGREYLFPKLIYTPFKSIGVIPMYDSQPLASFYDMPIRENIANHIVRNSKHKLYFKQSAYNWIAVSIEPAPCYDSNGKRIIQTQVSDISFNAKDVANLALLFLNGKLFLSKWLTFGDEFHLTKDDIVSTPFPFQKISESDKTVLLKYSEEFVSRLNDTIQYKLNAGKNVGTYNTSKLWNITDKSDLIFLKYLTENPIKVFQSVEAHIGKTVITIEDDE